MSSSRIKAQAPARLCLFGEHQDYLGLPVIAMSIDLYLNAMGQTTDDGMLKLKFHDMGAEDAVDLSRSPFDDRHENDFVHSSLRVLERNGHRLRPLELEFSSTIPVNSGAPPALR